VFGSLLRSGTTIGGRSVSITPKKSQLDAEGEFKHLPIMFKIESGFQSLGEFLVYLEEFPRSLTCIESLNIRARGAKPPKLDVEATVSICMEAGDGQK